jgi:gliding motility-associated-like protein
MKFLFSFLCFISCLCVSAQEICNNAKDDDGDGLIDLLDSDCQCSDNFVLVKDQSIIPNPSFEEYTQCPTTYSQMDFVQYWRQASGEGTTDFVHACNNYRLDVGQWQPLPPLPLPDGKGCAGFIDGIANQIFYSGTYKEYAGAVLHSPLLKNQTYLFDLSVGFGTPEKSPPIEISIYGHPSREAFPIEYRAECPSKYFPEWILLGSQWVGGNNEWKKVSIEINSPIDISSIAIGPPCPEAPDSLLYYYLDQLMLYRKEDAGKPWINISSSPLCQNTRTLRSNVVDGPYQYQWYKNGIAISGERKDSLVLSNKEKDNGVYQLTITSGTSCQVTKNFDYTYIPKTWNWVDLGPDIIGCPGQTYVISTPENEIERNGRYIYWSNGNGYVNLTVTESGKYWLDMVVVDVWGRELCRTSDTVIVDLSGVPDIDFGPQQLLCDNEPIVIGSDALENASHKWNTGSTDPFITINNPGVYTDTVTLDGCVVTDSVVIRKNPLSVNLGADVQACEGNEVVFQPDIPAGTSLLWKGQLNARSYVAHSAEQVTVEAELEGCIRYDTASVSFIPSPIVDLGSDAVVCPDQAITLDAGDYNNANYVWTTGAATRTISPNKSGEYGVLVTADNGCFDQDTIEVQFNSVPVLELGPDLSLCRSATVNFIPKTSFGDKFLWNDGVQTPSRTFSSTGVFTLQASNGCGSVSEEIIVKDAGVCTVTFPNAFTPNHDGKNDIFRSNQSSGIDHYNLHIFSRWGQLVFKSSDPSVGWDGTISGQLAPTGNYIWKARYRLIGSGELKSENGSVTLVR